MKEAYLMESLQGHFLISTRQMPDPRFQEQVIYLCAHNDEGAMGLVVNNPSQEITLLDVLHGAGLPVPEDSLPSVYIGGPVGTDSGFILYAAEETGYASLDVADDVFLSRDMRLLEEIARGQGPDDYLFLLGYAGWGPGQLETELMDNGWLTVPAGKEILFHTADDSKWKMAAYNYGIDISVFGDVIGYA